MVKQVLQILFVFIPFLFFVRCAQIVPLTGGKKDVTAPRVLNAIPANNTTGFNSEVIVLQFDEYIKLTDLANQLIVSPKLKTSPDVTSDRKNILITLKREDLAPNTTYRFSFGKAIVDMNEGNALPDFAYVFSTGTFIDSLTIKGITMDAFTDKPGGNMLVGLYSGKRNNDSLPYLQPPDYMVRSNDNGEFNFKNLPYSSFDAYAIDDKNKNAVYDGETEKVAFLDSPLDLRSDSSLRFRLFQEESSKNFIKKTVLPYPGFIQILLNKKNRVSVLALHPRDSASILETNASVEKDTISIYYKNIKDTLGLILHTENKTDTLKIALPPKRAVKKRFQNYSFNASGGTLPLNALPTLVFQNWMDILSANPAEIRLTSRQDSSLNLSPVTGHWLDVNRYEITNTLMEGANYSLKVDTCAFLDVNAVCNDSTNITFKTESRLEFGKVSLKVLLNKKQGYLIQLINEKGDVIRQSFISLSLSASNAVTIDFADVTPGIYLVKIVFDTNENHKWDSGNLLLKRQPERVIINSKQIKVLSDWEIEEEIQIRE